MRQEPLFRPRSREVGRGEVTAPGRRAWPDRPDDRDGSELAEIIAFAALILADAGGVREVVVRDQGGEERPREDGIGKPLTSVVEGLDLGRRERLGPVAGGRNPALEWLRDVV